MSYADDLLGQIGGQAAGQAVGTIFDIATQGWRNANQLQQNQELLKQQVQAQEELGKFNYGQQLDMWNATNTEAQLAHIKNAGLNPALLYGKGGAGGSTIDNGGMASASVSGASADPRPGGNTNIGMNIQTAAQVRLMNAQADLAESQATKTSGVDTQVGQSTIAQLAASTANTQAQTALTKINTQIASIDQSLKEATYSDVAEQISLQAQAIQQQVFQLRNQTDISDATKSTMINTIKQQYINSILTGALTKSNITVNDAQINKMTQDIMQRGQEIDIKQFEAEIRANQPSVGEISGAMLLSIKTAIDKAMGLDKEYVTPRKINK